MGSIMYSILCRLDDHVWTTELNVLIGKIDPIQVHAKGLMKTKSFVPALEDETIGVEHLLAELKNDNVSMESVLSLKKTK